MTDASGSQVLIVDDEFEIRTLVSQYLEKNGLHCHIAANPIEARPILDQHKVDIIILDVMMPEEDGLTFCRKLRASSTVPIILLTSMADETDRVVGLELGADDYLTKPFAPRELLARIRTVLRRYQTGANAADTNASRRIRFDGWEFNLDEHTLVNPQGEQIPLSGSEFKLLEVFLRNPRKVLSRDDLQNLVHGRDGDLFERSIDNQISRLRRKMELDSKQPAIIETVWGAGYKFTGSLERG